MTTDKLQTANELSKKIVDAQKVLNDTKDKPADIILFSTTGSNNRSVVCSDPDLIDTIRAMLVTANQATFDNLTQQFNNL